jgi:exopolyphosphatase/guanosine-5'-triphosphate,3'-diphosphate pyrophosphatase
MANSPTTDKREAVLRWVKKNRGDVSHELRVEKLALTLFTLTRETHGLTANERSLLSLAALVHDVGRAMEDDDHELYGAVMLDAAADLPLTDTERRRMMFMTRYHRGEVARENHEDYLKSMDDRQTARLLLGFLRAADALDSRNLETPRIAISVGKQALSITCYLREVTAKALRKFGKKKKFLLLEETLKMRILVDLRRVEGVELVA